MDLERQTSVKGASDVQPNDSVATLSRALDQTGDVLAAIHRDQLSDPTPCPDWDVAHLIGHVLGAPGASPRPSRAVIRTGRPRRNR